MSIRELNAAELVTAPRLDAREALALGTQIVAVAREEGAKSRSAIPAPVERAVAGLDARRGELEAALVTVAPSLDTKRSRRADHRVDAFHAGLSEFLYSFVRLPADVSVALEAERVVKTLYPEGLAFTQSSFRREWAESKVVLERVAAEGLDPIIRRLGGGVFLDGLADAHREYGEALGVTQPKAAGPDPIALREPLDAFRAALKRFILLTAAHGEDDAAPGAKALSEALLRPVVDAARRSVSPVVEPAESPASA